MKSSKFLKWIKSAYRLLKLHMEVNPAGCIISIVSAIILGFCPVLSAYAIKQIVDLGAEVIMNTGPQRTFGEIALSVLPWVALEILSTMPYAITGYLNLQINTIANKGITEKLRHRMFDKMQRVDISVFDDPKYREMYERASAEVGEEATLVIDNLINLIRTIITNITFAIMIIKYKWWLFVLIILLSLPTFFIGMRQVRKFFTIRYHNTPALRKMGYFGSTLCTPDTQRELRIFNFFPVFRKKYHKAYNEYIKLLKEAVAYDTKGSVITTVFDNLGKITTLFYLAVQLFSGNISVGDFTIFKEACATLQYGTELIYGNISSIYQVTMYFDNYDEFMNTVPEMNTSAMMLPEGKTEIDGDYIEFKNVSFKYPCRDEYVLKNVSFRFELGKSVAIVGSNGAGKSTIVKLMLRFYEPTEGEIYLGDTDVRNIPMDMYYKKISAVLQDYAKYSLTLYESIACESQEDESLDRFNKIYNSLGLSDIECEPEREMSRLFDTAGKEPSIGQWQKIAIARAFYKDPDFIILDEPSSALDPDSECELYSMIKKASETKTVVYISHRLVSTVFADKILLIKDGTIYESGTHEELLAMNGEYARMFNSIERLYSLNKETAELEESIS